MKNLSIAAWLAACVLSVWIATQAVAIVREEVSEPRNPIAASTALADNTNPPLPQGTSSLPPSSSPGAASTVGPTVSSSTAAPSSTIDAITVAPSSTVTNTSSAPTSTTVPVSTTEPPSTTATSAPTTTTTLPSTTTTAVPPSVRTYQLAGGWVRLALGNGTVELDGAAPAMGYTLEIEDNGPDRVKVRFRSDDHESRLEARWRSGELVVDIEEV